MTFYEHVKKAWYDAVLPQATEEERENADYREYLLGWPANELDTQDALFNTLFRGFRMVAGTLTVPLFVLLKRVPEFLLFNLASEAFAWLEAQSKEQHGSDYFSAWAIPRFFFNILGKLFRLCVSPLGFAMWAINGDDDHLRKLINRISITQSPLLWFGFTGLALITLAVIWAFVPVLLMIMLASFAADIIVLPQLGEFRPIFRMLTLYFEGIKASHEEPVSSLEEASAVEPVNQPFRLLEALHPSNAQPPTEIDLSTLEWGTAEGPANMQFWLRDYSLPIYNYSGREVETKELLFAKDSRGELYAMHPDGHYWGCGTNRSWQCNSKGRFLYYDCVISPDYSIETTVPGLMN